MRTWKEALAPLVVRSRSSLDCLDAIAELLLEHARQRRECREAVEDGQRSASAAYSEGQWDERERSSGGF